MNYFETELKNLDLSKDQHLMSIRLNGIEHIGDVEIQNDKIIVSATKEYKPLEFSGIYNNFVELIYKLQGYDIKIDDFYF